MLRQTFCHLPGVGPKVEQKLWSSGVHSWEAFLEQCDGHAGHPGRKNWPQLIEQSQEELEKGNSAYFAARLRGQQLWRMYKDFRHTCAFLDIETTGLGGYGDYVTAIAMYDGECIRCYVHGINLDDFPRDVQDYKLLITYNGTTFDLPFLEREFNMSFPQAHIDLRYLLHGLGFKGGLKSCEKQLGIARPGMEDLDGFAAVLLWHEYRGRSDEKALETLLAYNVQDTINLEVLMHEAFYRKIKETPFVAMHQLPQPSAVENPYTPNPRLVKKVVKETSWRLPFPTR